MKSIVEQASTVLKAIEKGWTQAGKPSEFTVKVYEHGVRNFFGMSVEPAKICILFEDKAQKSSAPKQHARQDNHSQPQSHHVSSQQQPRKEFASQSEQRKQSVQPSQQQPRQQQQSVVPQAPVQNRQKKEVTERAAQPVSTKIIWSDELIDACNQWLTTTLAVMGKGDCMFTIEAKKYHLIITFSQAVLEDKEREKALFRSFAHVLMQSLRNRFKKGLRGYRIVLNTSQD